MKYLPLIAMTGLIAGCSSFNSLTDTTNLVDYSNHKSVKLLEVPADLDTPAFDSTYITNVSDDLVANKSVTVSGGVPLVDGAMTTPTASSMAIVKQGSQLVLKVSDGGSALWKSFTDALKAMGMTISKSDQATGVMQVRDRSLVSSPDSMIGAFLNRTVGRVNSGAEYLAIAKADTIVFTAKGGGVLPESESRSLLTRLKKELTSSK